MRRPPRSTLFPYTTSSDLLCFGTSGTLAASSLIRSCSPSVRSEEHTSELQTLTNLVCRLLLEKKKQAMGNCETASPHANAVHPAMKLQHTEYPFNPMHRIVCGIIFEGLKFAVPIFFFNGEATPRNFPFSPPHRSPV